MTLPMKGWKTWLAVAGAVGSALVAASQGDYGTMVQSIIAAIGMIGIGSKIEKMGQ